MPGRRAGRPATGVGAIPVVGIDMVRVADVSAAIERFGERYLKRVYTEAELAYATLGAPPERDRRLAARFAAKEAALKVLRPQGHWFDWRHLEVTREPGGAGRLALHGAAARLAAQQGLGSLALSLSHEDPFAVAVVMGLCRASPAGASGLDAGEDGRHTGPRASAGRRSSGK